MLVCPLLDRVAEGVSFCGVFDGTAGSEAVEFVQKNFLVHLMNTEVFFPIIYDDIKNILKWFLYKWIKSYLVSEIAF